MADDDVKWGPNPYARPYAEQNPRPAMPKKRRQRPVVPGVTEEAEDKAPPMSSRLADAYRGRRS